MAQAAAGTTAGRARPLPADLPALLSATFRAEVAERLPRLRAAAAQLDGSGTAAAAVVAEVHPLASGAAVVGRGEIAAEARWCEQALAPYDDVPGDAGGVTYDAAAVGAVRERLAHLLRLLTDELAS